MAAWEVNSLKEAIKEENKKSRVAFINKSTRTAQPARRCHGPPWVPAPTPLLSRRLGAVTTSD